MNPSMFRRQRTILPRDEYGIPHNVPRMPHGGHHSVSRPPSIGFLTRSAEVPPRDGDDDISIWKSRRLLLPKGPAPLLLARCLLRPNASGFRLRMRAPFFLGSVRIGTGPIHFSLFFVIPIRIQRRMGRVRRSDFVRDRRD